MEKRFNGKAIYEPKGKAAEYAPWACNFFTGCSNDCDYCYCKRGVMNHVWDTKPNLKKCFKDEDHAIDVFIDEMEKNISELRKHGIFFSFTTDPMLPETLDFHMNAVLIALERDVPVQILTKRADFTHYWFFGDLANKKMYDKLAIGFTLTGVDQLENYASPNKNRIITMKWLHDIGIKTFASIEPIIDPIESWAMINTISGWCDLIKVGLLSGKRAYGQQEIECLVEMIKADTRGSKFYLKDSVVSYLGIDRDSLPAHFVNANYNIFKSHE